MDPDRLLTLLLPLAVPFYFVLFAVELLWARHHALGWHDGRETLGSILLAAAEQAIYGLLALPLFGVYVAVHALAPRPLDPGSPWTWVVALVGLDFLFYWFHRACHEVAIGWAVHGVHHQARDFNFSVALRSPFLGRFVQLGFLLPLALLGVPPAVFAVCKTLQALHAFCLHTRAFPRMPWVEAVFVTPSVHRVHHARNARYIDRNFGGLFTVWDRWFGTWQPEDEPPRFADGTRSPGPDPVWANLRPWTVLAARIRRAATPGRALAIALGAPGDDEDPLADLSTERPSLARRLCAWTLLGVALPAVALAGTGEGPLGGRIALAGFAIGTVVLAAAIHEHAPAWR
jgi:sterol desaturase/sphingolipid hydroxylase (fatty acid hydroxylase superfamily)